MISQRHPRPVGVIVGGHERAREQRRRPLNDEQKFLLNLWARASAAHTSCVNIVYLGHGVRSGRHHAPQDRSPRRREARERRAPAHRTPAAPSRSEGGPGRAVMANIDSERTTAGARQPALERGEVREEEVKVVLRPAPTAGPRETSRSRSPTTAAESRGRHQAHLRAVLAGRCAEVRDRARPRDRAGIIQSHAARSTR